MIRNNCFNDFSIFDSGSRQNKKYSCVCLHGDRKPQERKANLEKFKKAEVKFLICTDVAARGIDIRGELIAIKKLNTNLNLFISFIQVFHS